MDLFVINRYTDVNADAAVDTAEQEARNLEKLKNRIAERKSAYATKKTSDVITLKPQKAEDNVDIKEEVPKTEQATISDNKNNIIKNEDEKKTKISHEFKVLGVNDFEKKEEVSRVLPAWLSHAFNIPTGLKASTCMVEDVDWLRAPLKATLLSEGITKLFPVQEQVIPYVLEEHNLTYPFWPHDICVSAPTGSGKTLAYVLPIVQILMPEMGCHVRALVVLPVQELAAQVAKVFKKYCMRTRLKVALLGGSTTMQQEQQNIVRYTESSGWTSEVDIIVCTAGRLVEHLQTTEGFSLKHLKFLVIDEADRIMDHIQNDWLYHVDKQVKLENKSMTGRPVHLSLAYLFQLKPPVHKLLFSATLTQDPEKLELWGLTQPRLFSTGKASDFEGDSQIWLCATPEELTEQFVLCYAEHKPLILYHFLIDKKWDKVLCFTNSAEATHRLAVLLDTLGRGKFKVAELSSALDKNQRESVLKQFTRSEINVLIGTDALARGIDISGCDYVVSYDVPNNIRTYIHRVGRTGRAGRTGHAVTLLVHNQVRPFQHMIHRGGKARIPIMNIDIAALERLGKSYEQAMSETKSQIHDEIDTKVKKSLKIKRRLNSKPQKRKLTE